MKELLQSLNSTLYIIRKSNELKAFNILLHIFCDRLQFLHLIQAVV